MERLSGNSFSHLIFPFPSQLLSSSSIYCLCWKETEDETVTLRRRPSHRRQSSVGITFYRNEEQHTSHRRRFSYASSSWMRDADDEDEADEISTRTGRSRPCSWGPVGEFFYRDSLSFCESERSRFSHQECNSQCSSSLRHSHTLNLLPKSTQL